MLTFEEAKQIGIRACIDKTYYAHCYVDVSTGEVEFGEYRIPK